MSLRPGRWHCEDKLGLIEAGGTEEWGIRPQKGCSQDLAQRREEEEGNRPKGGRGVVLTSTVSCEVLALPVPFIFLHHS